MWVSLKQVKVKVKSLSHVWLFATPWTVAYQAPPSTGFSRQEYWSGLPFPSPTLQGRKHVKQCTGSRQSWDKRATRLSRAPSIWRRRHWRPRGRKRGRITCSHASCRCFWHLCFCIRALILLSSKGEETCSLQSQKNERYFPDLWWEPQRWPWTKLGRTVMFTLRSPLPLSPILVCLLQAVALSSHSVPHPLAPNLEFLVQCRIFSQLPEVWYTPSPFLI